MRYSLSPARRYLSPSRRSPRSIRCAQLRSPVVDVPRCHRYVSSRCSTVTSLHHKNEDAFGDEPFHGVHRCAVSTIARWRAASSALARLDLEHAAAPMYKHTPPMYNERRRPRPRRNRVAALEQSTSTPLPPTRPPHNAERHDQRHPRQRAPQRHPIEQVARGHRSHPPQQPPRRSRCHPHRSHVTGRRIIRQMSSTTNGTSTAAHPPSHE